jgi:diguanylate cyclase (GGDEF)-like protein/PAS domain S-box-containing protein
MNLSNSSAQAAVSELPAQDDGKPRVPGMLPLAALALMLLASRLALVRYAPMISDHPVRIAVFDTVLLFVALLLLLRISVLVPQARQAQRSTRAQRALQQHVDSLQGILDHALDGIVLADRHGQIQELNPAAERMFGMSAAEARGQHVSSLISVADRAGLDSFLANAMDAGVGKTTETARELQAVRKNAEIFSVEFSLVGMNLHGERRLVAMMRDIGRRKQEELAVQRKNIELEQRVRERTTQLAQVNEALNLEIEQRRAITTRLGELATSDELTGACNRREFDRILTAEFERAQRYNVSLALIMLDIDGFKAINEKFGRAAGDAALAELARLASASIRLPDVFARWGGDEFVLLAPGNDASGALGLAEKLRQKIAAHAFPVAGRITCTLGAVDNAGCDTAADMLTAVDRLLRSSKELHRNRALLVERPPVPD